MELVLYVRLTAVIFGYPLGSTWYVVDMGLTVVFSTLMQSEVISIGWARLFNRETCIMLNIHIK